ncbi:hypothetical protein [Faecalitalea cylindroides]|uniref:Uncharacterized protein n=1 Tax=Faecalitalea cylindroides ATCC 27803 TaxID=649755 RepID=U2QZD1_9FIRM|nr:hypothetical protein [Faecalitalea cylindroides]ERK46663.1 hypothetical protein HMPREF0367_00460 [[Eubacterium] cylindroides ATCC 27803] [Faecalitalea cylindroides ATCC 27803]
MSAYTNSIKFWESFQKVQEELKKCLSLKKYERLNELVEGLDEEVYSYTGAHFFVENLYDEYEMTFDTGPNKTTQYLCSLFSKTAPESIKKSWIINACLPPLSQKAIQAEVQIKDQSYTLTDFHVFYKVVENTQTIACQLYCPAYQQIKNPENKKEMSMYLIELAIGQCAYEAYLSSVDFLDVPPEEDQPFCNLVDLFEKIMDIVEKNEWKEYNSPLEIYSVYQPIQDIGHDSLRKDMKYIFTTHPLLIEETIENKKDVLLDLSSKDGEYGFVYFSNMFHNKEDALFRQSLSKQLDDQISKLNAGKVIGGAIGKSYSYIDWIVYDKTNFIKALESAKKQLNKSVELHYESFNDILD